jgi:D-galactarolactone isomerase
VIVHSKADSGEPAGTLETVSRLGLPRARAVVWDDPSRSGEDRERLHLAGVRGVRFLYPAGVPPDVAELHRSATRIAPHGWHLLVQADGGSLHAALLAELCTLACPVVIDHIGRFAPDVDAGSRTFGALVRFVRDGGWVKLAAPYYGTADGSADFGPLRARIHALLDAGGSRIIWGMNWPHVNLKARPDEARMLETLLALFRSQDEARAVLATNAARLYGFAEAASAID